MDKIIIRKPNDFHHHLRDGDNTNIIYHAFTNYNYVLAMPNLNPPITTITQALGYENRIYSKTDLNNVILLTLYFNNDISIETLMNIPKYRNIFAVKYYPLQGTTNSQYGTKNLEMLYDKVKILEEYDIPLLIHGETTNPKVDIFKREYHFITEELNPLIDKFPNLRVVMEHISTQQSAEFINELPKDSNVYATITPHHLFIDRNEMLSGGINSHLYCMPILKSREDKEALANLATSGNNRVFYGSDNAPHNQKFKTLECCKAGIFNSPVGIQITTQVFDNYGRLDNLDRFMSMNGADFYKLPYNDYFIELEKKEWTVPNNYDEYIPIYSNKKLNWQITNKIITYI